MLRFVQVGQLVSPLFFISGGFEGLFKNLWHVNTVTCKSTLTGTAVSACLPIHDAVAMVTMEDRLECFQIGR